MHQSAFNQAFTNFIVILFFCHFTNLQIITIILSKPKTERKKHLDETILIIIILYNTRKLHLKITNYVKISKLIVMQIIQYISKNLNVSYYKTKCLVLNNFTLLY